MADHTLTDIVLDVISRSNTPVRNAELQRHPDIASRIVSLRDHSREVDAVLQALRKAGRIIPSTKGWTVAAVKICSRCNGTGYEREAT